MLAKPVFGQFSVNQITNMIAADDLNNLLDYYNDIWNTPQEYVYVDVSAGSFIVGRQYKIKTVGTTDFTTVGAADSVIDTVFTATDVGTGTGVAQHMVATNIVFDFPSHNNTTGNSLERRFGWGQGPATFLDSANNVRTLSHTHITTGIGTEITITDINQTIAQLNAGLYHTEDDPTLAGLIPQTIDTGQRIPKSLYETVANKIESFIAEPTNKYKTDYHSIDLYTTQLATTSSTPWAEDLEVVHKFTFTDYNEARYFFNSGGEFTLELEMAAGGSAGNQVWQDIFNQFDSIRIGAETCRVAHDDGVDDGETQYDVIATSGLNKGFYTGITYAATPVFETILDAGVFNYNSGSEYSAFVYVYSEYNSRRIRIQLSAVEDTPGGTFNIYVKVILVEDINDIFNITQPITLTSGYVQPSTVPTALDGNNTYMTVGSKLFVFEERVAPVVSPHSGWTLVNVTAGEQLSWVDGTSWNQVNGPLYDKIVTAGAFIVGRQYKILVPGTTNFTLIGAADSNVDTVFTATGVGTGTGTATRV